MKRVTVTFTDGDYFVTRINGSEETIRDYYYIGCIMNMGTTDDNFKTIGKVEIHE